MCHALLKTHRIALLVLLLIALLFLLLHWIACKSYNTALKMYNRMCLFLYNIYYIYPQFLPRDTYFYIPIILYNRLLPIYIIIKDLSALKPFFSRCQCALYFCNLTVKKNLLFELKNEPKL